MIYVSMCICQFVLAAFASGHVTRVKSLEYSFSCDRAPA